MNRWIKRGAKLDAESGKWFCRSCGGEVDFDFSGECNNVVEVVLSTKEEIYCDGLIGKPIDGIAVAHRRRVWALETCTDSFTVPEYLRTETVKALKLSKKVQLRTISLWYNEIRETVRHANEVCPPRPPLSKKAETARKGTLSQAVWR